MGGCGMKYCPKCKVNVHHQLDNCPLCGSYLDKTNDNGDCAIYAPMDEKISYPTLKENEKTNFFKWKINIILLVATVICVLLNILINPQSHWSSYVAMGFIFVVGCVLVPISNKTKLTKQVRWDIVILTVLAVSMELAVTNGKFYWISVEFVMPAFYVIAIVLIDFLIFFQHRSNRELFSHLIYCTAFAVIPQIVLWIARGLKWYEAKTIITFVIFFASLLNLAVVFVIYSKQLKEDMERTLNV